MDLLSEYIIFYGFFVELMILAIIIPIWRLISWIKEPKDSKEIKRINRKRLNTKLSVTDDGKIRIIGFKRQTPEWGIDKDGSYGLLPSRGKILTFEPKPPPDPAFNADGSPKNLSEKELADYKNDLAQYEADKQKFLTNEQPHLIAAQDKFNDIVNKKFTMESTGSPTWIVYESKGIMCNPSTLKLLQNQGLLEGTLLNPMILKEWIERSWPSSKIHTLRVNAEEEGARKVRSMMTRLEKMMPLLMLIVAVGGLVAIVGLVYYFVK
jgi:hypothetical protein